MDEKRLEAALYGSRGLTRHLLRLGDRINRKRGRRLMRLMRLAVHRPLMPNTSKLHWQHKVYPCLLRNLDIDRPNQISATDIPLFRWSAD